jgi:hypothetical protein
MIACLYGKTAEPFVTAVVADLQAAASARHREIAAVAIETAVQPDCDWQSVERLYVLPFDVPLHLPESLPPAPALLVRELFPRADLINAPAVHELCWDKLAMARRLLERGVPMPETLITSDPQEARDFVRRHEQAILKETRSCGGHGHVVVFADDSGSIGGETPGRRYVIDFEDAGLGRSLAHGVLSCPPPFYLQRLVTGVRRSGALEPAQILRAYVVDGQVVFWTERYRARVQRPSDFIINATFGAKYRFLPEVSDAAQTLGRRAAEVLGARIGVVDLVRSGDDGPYVLEVDTDGYHMMIDRSFKQLPEYRHVYDFDRFIADQLLAPAAIAPKRRPDERGRSAPRSSAARPRRPKGDRRPHGRRRG